jgi:hypothetical protein
VAQEAGQVAEERVRVSDFGFNLNSIGGVGLMAILAAAAAFWRQARSFAQYVSGFLLLQKTVQSGMSATVGIHIRRTYKKLPSGISEYRSLLSQIDDNTTCSYVPFDMPSATTIWWGPRGIFLVSASESLKLVSIRGLSDPQGLIVDALNGYEEIRKANAGIGFGNFYVRKCMGNAGDPGAFMRGLRGGAGAEVPSTAVGYSSTNQAPAAPQSTGSWSEPDHTCDESFMYERHRYISNKKQRDPFQGLFYEDDALKLVEDLKQWFVREDGTRSTASRGVPASSCTVPEARGRARWRARWRKHLAFRCTSTTCRRSPTASL